ncbi:MAG TPA: trypsin-like peptidase domain-containing protein [Thermoanaerobaculia bacterium]
MSRNWSLTVLAVASLSTVPLFAASVPVRISTESEREIYDVSDKAEQQAVLHRSLVQRESAKGLARAIEVKLTAEEKEAAEAQVVDGRLRVGIDKPVGVAFKIGPAIKFGDVASSDGAFVWSGRVSAPGATAIRLHLAPFDLPESAELYVYSADGQAFGPYSGRGPIDDGELWTNAIFGEEVRLQIRVAAEDAARTRLVIADVGYLGAGLPMAGSNLCAANAACVINAGCASIPAAIAPARDAVATILFASGGSHYICSGGLIADSDTASVVPYFLTANHCVSTASEASSVETYFDYETTCSSPNCTQPYGSAGETVGSQIVRGNSTGDYTLLRLSSTPVTRDGVTTYLGWSTTAVANTNGTGLYRLSHPKGSPQAYSTQNVDTSKPTCGSWPRGSWIYSRDTSGATEGGSSGSPVLNAQGKIVGQLSGACGFNLNDVCDNASNATVDGAFASYYSQVAPYLGPGGGPQCSPSGASCSANSQCCSGNCKGKPGSKSCK